MLGIRANRAWALILAALLIVAGATGALAQTAPVDSEKLLADVSSEIARTGAAIDGDHLGSSRIEEIRAGMETRRQQLLAASKALGDQLAPLRAALDALGPAPEDGTQEADDVAAKRADLESRIQTLDGLQKRVQSALTQVQTIGEQLVDLRRKKFTRQLLERQPTPVSPARVSGAWESLETRANVIAREVRARINADGSDALFDRLALPMLLTIAAFGLAIWLRRRLVRWIRVRVDDEVLRARRARLTAAITLVRLILPTVGIGMTLIGIRESGLLGPNGMVLATNVAIASAVMIFGYAFGSAYFAPRSRGLRLSSLSDGRASAAYWWYILLVINVALDQLLVASGGDLRLSTDALSVLNAILLVIGGFTLWRFVRTVGLGELPAGDDAEETLHEAHVFARVARTILHFVALVAPALALIGFYGASRFLFYPVVYTAAVIGAALLLYLWVVAMSTPVAEPKPEGEAEDAEEGAGKAGEADDEEPRLSVLPVITGFTLTFLALPVLAIIWGAKATDLQSAWTVIVEGFRVGEITISPMDFLIFAVVFAIGFFLTRIVQSVLRRSVMPVLRIDPGAKAALLAGFGYVGIVISALVAISTTALDLSNLAIVAGALSVGIGFGLQNVVNNFVSGIILLIERPIKIGDWVEVGGQHGIVRRINVRSTQIQTFDRSTMFVPNADLISNSVTNWYYGDGQGRLILKVGVAYGSDVRLVEKILLEAARAHPMVLRTPEPFVVFADFGASSLDFELRGIMADVNMILTLPSELRYTIYRRFNEEGIEIPFAQHDITIRNLADLRHARHGGSDETG